MKFNCKHWYICAFCFVSFLLPLNSIANNSIYEFDWAKPVDLNLDVEMIRSETTACEGSIPFCTSDDYIFPASTDVSSLGSVGCLYTTPNPAWYWMEIADPGDIEIYISSGGDVDFIAWGPFSSLAEACATDLMSNSGVDCSYSTSATETCNIDDAQTGEVYVLLITNYANISTNISFNQTSGAGSTNCGIIAPPIDNNGPLCEGDTLQLIVSNPTTGATYNWTGPNGWSSTDMNPIISGTTCANEGTYSLVITVGTEISDPVTTDVVINPNINPTFDLLEPYCFGASIPALPTTSNNSITGTWSPAIDNTTTTTYTFTPDTGQCATTTTLDITIYSTTASSSVNAAPLCNGDSNGAIDIAIGSGIADFNIDWGTSNTTTSSNNYTINGLPAGSYIITVSDVNGCQDTTSVTLVEPNPLVISEVIDSHLDVDCNGNATGELEVTAIDGTTPYSYTLEGGTSQTSGIFTGLSAGTYILEVTDAHACSDNMTIEILENPILTVSIPSSIDVLCNGDCDGSATAICSGGDSLYFYDWSNCLTTATISSLCAGVYTVTASDGNGCNSEASVTINENPAVTAVISESVDVTCNGGFDGSATVLAGGGDGSYTYSWGDSLTISTATGLYAGSYAVTVYDGNLCEATTSVTINENPPIVVSVISSSDVLCYGDCTGSAIVTASGGDNNLSYRWSDPMSQNTAIASNLCSGNYFVTVSDGLNCSSDAMVRIQEPAPLEVGYMITNPSCIGNSDGAVEIQVVGGTFPYLYLWSDAMVSLPFFDGLYEGTYEIIVKDANDCMSEIENITLIDFPEECLRVPDAFTPNGDGNNDTWIIENLDLFNNYHIEVFNRWGQILYDAEPGSMPWDGKTLEGKSVPSGTYLYAIRLFNGLEPKTGVVTVVY